MHAHQEIELKWSLTAAAYTVLGTKLTSAFGTPREIRQENRFYDTPDRRLRAQGCNLRLRRENERWLVTCKRRLAPVSDGLHQHEEWEAWLPAGSTDPLTAALALTLPDTVRSALNGVTPQALGGFANDRQVWLVHDEELCLDRTDFGSRIDYEIEIETHDPHASRLRWQQHFTAWAVSVEPQSRSKFARFCELHPEVRRGTTAA